MASNGLCPQCRRPLTPGVLNRVQQLATRPEGYLPDTRQGYQSMVPLVGLLSEICGVGPKTKKVAGFYNKALALLGPELAILLEKRRDEIEKAGIPLLAEAIARMRKGAVKISPGFDGEYGRVSLFDDGEKEVLLGEPELFPVHGKPASVKKPPARKKNATTKESGRAALAFAAEKLPPPLLDVTLNDEQGRALAVADRPLIIEAGPGTGKTRTIIEKIKHLVAEEGVDPGAVLVLTFTNRAAGEVKERIQKAVPGAGTEVAASTFHAFCLKVLKHHGDFQSSIADETVRKELLKQACLNVGYGNSRSNPAFDRVDQIMATAKQHCLSLEDDLGDLAGPEEAAVLKRVWAEYNRLMVSLNLVDFEDLLVMVLALMKREGRLLLAMQQRFSRIFVDEYQDINLGQYRLVRLLADEGKGLTVIGDPDQSIYGFRGSDNRYFRKFMDDYPDAVKIVLTRNYRSTQTILDASFQMITRAEKNGEKEKLSSRVEGRARVEILEAASDRAEAAVVGKKIENLVGGISLFSMDAGKADHGSGRGYSFSDFAVLYRTRKQSQLFARAFEKAGIPFQTADRENLVAQQGIKELMALVRIAVQRWTVFDLEILLDHMEAGAGNKTKEKLRQWFYTLDRPAGGPSDLLVQTPLTGIGSHIRKNISRACAELERFGLAAQGRQPEEALEILAGESGITGVLRQSETGAAAYNRLLLHAQGCTGGLTAFLDSLALDGDTESIEPGAEKVSLMTIHGAKGLEFPVVFVTGCEQGLLPYAGRGKGVEDMDEERRLFYVAMTRAKDLLCLAYAKKRTVFGAVKKSVKSRFLSDIEEQLKAYQFKGGRFKNKQPKAKQLELF
ncbi:MAG TPA: UvrD-helicase domain-containing protein, partial [Desulfobacteraceae bacterium]|nr:UvrD-helicase domain-containing protein [Desulfobacteraceae bacterium]